jgi:hypothetical protein
METQCIQQLQMQWLLGVAAKVLFLLLLQLRMKQK